MVLCKKDANNLVTFRHNFPEKLSEQDKIGSFEVESVPLPESIEGKGARLYHDDETGFYYVYEDKISTVEKDNSLKIIELQAENETLKLMIAELGLGV